MKFFRYLGLWVVFLGTNFIFSAQSIEFLDECDTLYSKDLILKSLNDIASNPNILLKIDYKKILASGFDLYLNSVNPPLPQEMLLQAIDWAIGKSLLFYDDWQLYFGKLVRSMSLALCVPVKSPVILSKIDDLKTICTFIVERLPQETVLRLFSCFLDQENEIPSVLNLISRQSPIMKSMLKNMISSSSREISLQKFILLVPRLDSRILETIYISLNPTDQELLLEAIFLNYLSSQELRNFVHKVFPYDSERIQCQIGECCVQNKAEHLLDVLFALSNPIYYESIKKQCKGNYSQPLPGHLGSNATYRVAMGEFEIYFTMNLEKFNTIHRLVEDINKNTVITVNASQLPECKVRILPEVIKHPQPLGYDRSMQPIYADEYGKKAIDRYVTSSNKQISDNLHLLVCPLQPYVSLGLNHDFCFWKRDPSPHSTTVKATGSPLDRDQMFFAEFSLVDWQMPKGTVAGILLHNGTTEDRYLISLHHHQALNMCLVGKDALPYHAILSPIDYQSAMTPGSTKGKNIVFTLGGTFPISQLQNLQKESTILEFNQKLFHQNSQGTSYTNGIIMKKKSCQESGFRPQMNWLGKRENTDIFYSDPRDQADFIHYISELFDIPNVSLNEVKVYHLSKRTIGLSQLKSIDLSIPEQSVIIIANRSIFPLGYKYYNLAEDQSDIGKPWIQLYHCPPDTLIKMEKSLFNRLSLSPIEELLYLNENNKDSNHSKLKQKLVSEFDIYVFPS